MYHFFWGEFCDWYLEIKKLSFDAAGNGAGQMPPAFENLCRALDLSLRLLHPMMPFITEELWQRLAERKSSIALIPFPAADTALLDEAAEREMSLLQEVIVNIRNMRAEMKVDARRKIPVDLYAPNGTLAQLATRQRPAIERLANLSALRLTSQPLQEDGGVLRSLPEFSLRIALADAVDVEAERTRLQKEEQKLEQELGNLKNQLGNEQFLAKAPGAIVANLRKRSGECAAHLQKVRETLRKLK
jgi:valyl-tRNA synthetase